MVLEPLREEALTDVDSERREKSLSSYDESCAMDPVPPTACGTTAERPYGQCHVIGTWDNFRDLHEMTWEGGALQVLRDACRERRGELPDCCGWLANSS